MTRFETSVGQVCDRNEEERGALMFWAYKTSVRSASRWKKNFGTPRTIWHDLIRQFLGSANVKSPHQGSANYGPRANNGIYVLKPEKTKKKNNYGSILRFHLSKWEILSPAELLSIYVSCMMYYVCFKDLNKNLLKLTFRMIKIDHVLFWPRIKKNSLRLPMCFACCGDTGDGFV